MLKHSGKRASALLLSLAVAAAAFAVPAYAGEALPMASQPQQTVSAPAEPLPQDPSSAVAPSQPETVSQPEVLPSEPEGTVSGGIEPTPDDPSSGAEGTVSGTEGTSSGMEGSSSGEPVSEPEAPVSEPEAPSSSVQQQPVASRPAQTNRPSYTPDTDQDEIDRLASQAAAGNNDAEEPLSSQDWSALLNQSGEPEEDPDSSMGAVSGEESGGESASSSAVQNSTRSSWLLPVGIVLILLAVAGIGTFVWLQFIQPRRRPPVPPMNGGRSDPSVDDGPFADPEGYTDISSAGRGGYTDFPSDDPEEENAIQEERAQPERPTPEEEALASQETMEIPVQRPRTGPEMEDIFSSDETEQLVRSGGVHKAAVSLPEERPAPQAARPDTPAVPEAQPVKTDNAPQAEPQQGGDQPFDWEKFFNDK